MERIYNSKNALKLTHQEFSRTIAIHEAGHAAAIYLGNQQKGFPQIFFRIFVNPSNNDLKAINALNRPYDLYTAKVEGGRLISYLPTSFAEATNGFSSLQKLAYEYAFEADMINILVGPLSEAKYVALRDDEPISPHLVTVNALPNYGGLSDLVIVNEYLDCFSKDQEARTRKLTELFNAAFDFINDRSHWLAITALANFILETDCNVIDYDDIVAVLSSSNRLKFNALMMA